MKYKSKCSECEKITPHIIYQINKRKGIRLQCEICNSLRIYRKANTLIQMKGGEKNEKTKNSEEIKEESY